MGSIRAEFGKLRRSLSWAVVVALPLMAVIAGTANTVVDGRGLDDGWHTLWVRVVVFYGLFPLAVGVAALASLIWRVEHRGGNWNALLARPVSSLEVMIGKLTVLAALAAVMQLVLLAGVLVAGTVVFGLPGSLPARYLLVSGVIVVACLPVAALQSALSMLMSSFAAPIAAALLGATASVLVLLAGIDAMVLALPHALLARATQLGTGMFADTGTLQAGTTALIGAASVVLTVVLTVAAAGCLDRRPSSTRG